MRRFAFYGVFLALFTVLFTHCDIPEHYSVSIANDSKKDVTYSYNGVSDILLPAGSAPKMYEVKAYTQPPQDIVDQYGIASVHLKTDNMTGNYTFVDAGYYNLNVTNNFPFELTISAGNFIDNGEQSGERMLLTVTPTAQNTEETDPPKPVPKIYTKDPRFVTTLSYPVVFEWEIAGNDMNVIIR